MTNKQLADEVKQKFLEAQKLLQMPPVLKVFEDTERIVANDKALKDFSSHSYVFSDVSFGIKDMDRSVVIRQPDGVLKEANYEIKKRVCQIFNPSHGRSFSEPKIFEPDNFKRLLEENKYEFLLDRACLQFEPCEARYHEITSQIYLHISEHLQFDAIRSTRHFGSMAFFLAWHKLIDNLLLDMIRNDMLKNAVQIICVLYKTNEIKEETENILKQIDDHEDIDKRIDRVVNNLLAQKDISEKIDKSNEDLKADEICFEFIQEYLNKYCFKKPQLKLALQTYFEWHNELKKIQTSY